MGRGELIWQMLEEPRTLSAEERRLIGRLSTAVDEPLLRRQVAAASVTAVCRCGCSSLRLHSAESPIPEARVLQLSGHDRSDRFAVETIGRARGLPMVQVSLHVIRGRIHELEIFAGEEGIPVPLASLTDLTDVTVA